MDYAVRPGQGTPQRGAGTPAPASTAALGTPSREHVALAAKVARLESELEVSGRAHAKGQRDLHQMGRGGALRDGGSPWRERSKIAGRGGKLTGLRVRDALGR